MRASSSRVAIVGSFATVFLLASHVPDAHASECLASSEVVVTSQVAVQVFASGPLYPLQGVAVSLFWEGKTAVPTATGTTDSSGHLRVQGVPPGRYRVQVGIPGLKDQTMSLRVVSTTDAPSRLIAFALAGGLNCGTFCTVAGTSGPLARAPKCLDQAMRR